MAGNRATTEAFILNYIDKIAPGTSNRDIYKSLFSDMNDKEFSAFIDKLENEEEFLILILPNFSTNGVTIENNLKIAESLGHNFFEKLWFEGKDDLPTYLTPIKYLIVDLPVRRASQLLIKKISVPDHNKIVDSMTGQPTGESKGARISYPELQVCGSMNLDNSMIELIKYRGGDNKGGIAYNAMLSKLGSTNLNTLQQYSSGVESTKTLKTFLTCCHLKSTL